MTKINRSASNVPATAVFTAVERRLFDHVVPDRPTELGSRKFLPPYLTKVVRLGGYLARASDPLGAPDSPISNWGSAWRSLWVIERLITRLLK